MLLQDVMDKTVFSSQIVFVTICQRIVLHTSLVSTHNFVTARLVYATIFLNCCHALYLKKKAKMIEHIKLIHVRFN